MCGCFPVIEGVRWTYRVHEQILPALKRAGVPVQWTASERNEAAGAELKPQSRGTRQKIAVRFGLAGFGETSLGSRLAIVKRTERNHERFEPHGCQGF
jgi:hypothetical protein